MMHNNNFSDVIRALKGMAKYEHTRQQGCDPGGQRQGSVSDHTLYT